MLNLTASTILTPDEAVERALACFGGGSGMKLIEMAGHIHGRHGAVQVTVRGDPVVGREKFEPLELLRSIHRDIRDRYGLPVAQWQLHFHTLPDETAGHMLVRIEEGHPVEVACESLSLDQLARDFLDGLPRPEGP
jgi:hypothetical protein